jgi:hypothetical protein
MLKPIEAGCKVLILNVCKPKNKYLIGKVATALINVNKGDTYTSPNTGDSIRYRSASVGWVLDLCMDFGGVSDNIIIYTHNLLRIDGEDFTDETYTEDLILDKEVFTQ